MLYGKIKKKCASQLRDSIFEFIAGCEDSDILLFFDLFFKQFPSNVKGKLTTELFYICIYSFSCVFFALIFIYNLIRRMKITI